MSDSSSAESSDDDLLASPVFTKKRAMTEKSKLNFFDKCLEGSATRTDELRRTFGLETEASGGGDSNDSGVKDEGSELEYDSSDEDDA